MQDEEGYLTKVSLRPNPHRRKARQREHEPLPSPNAHLWQTTRQPQRRPAFLHQLDPIRKEGKEERTRIDRRELLDRPSRGEPIGSRVGH